MLYDVIYLNFHTSISVLALNTFLRELMAALFRVNFLSWFSMGPWPWNSGCFRSAVADFWSFSKIFTSVAIIAWLVTHWHYFLIRDASVVTPRVVDLKKYHMCVCFDFQLVIRTLDRSLTEFWGDLLNGSLLMQKLPQKLSLATIQLAKW